jgi:predicted small metal-binding protein
MAHRGRFRLAEKEDRMARKIIDCRDFPSETKCSIAIAADTEEEILDVAVPHAVSKHGHQNTPELRDHLRQGIKEAALR